MKIKRVFSFFVSCRACLRFCTLLLAVTVVVAQQAVAAAATPAPANKAAKSEKSKEPEPPKPEDFVLTTGDRLELSLTYYRGTKGKETIPVVLLHMWKQSRGDYRDLATALQRMGHAAIVPDLRGHGQSTIIRGARRQDALKAATLPPAQFTAMVTQDMRAVKSFLLERNNAGELNIDKLCVVGAEMGAGVALNFAASDALDQENNRVFGADREYKLGRFVKALVLLSPRSTFSGLPIWSAVSNPVVQRDIPVMIFVGKQDNRSLEEAIRLNGIFAKYHHEPTGEDRTDHKTLWLIRCETKLQGTKLLDPKFKVPALIGDFIYRRLVKCDESKDWVWRERKSAY